MRHQLVLTINLEGSLEHTLIFARELSEHVENISGGQAIITNVAAHQFHGRLPEALESVPADDFDDDIPF